MTTAEIENRRLKASKKVVLILLIVFVANIIITGIAYAADDNRDDPVATYESIRNTVDADRRGMFDFVARANGWDPNFSVYNIIRDIAMVGNYKTQQSSVVPQEFVNLLGDTYNGIQVVGLAYLVLYFFLSLMDKALMEQFNVEQILKKVIMLCICMFIIMNGSEIFKLMIDFGNAFLDDLKEWVINGPAAQKELENLAKQIKDPGSIGYMVLCLGLVLENLLLYLVQFVYVLIIYITMVSRSLELGIRYIFAPIGMAPLVHDGLRSSGARYIKQFASLCIQGAVTLGVVFLSTNLGTMGTGIIAKIVLPVVTIAALFKVKNYADDIIGVH